MSYLLCVDLGTSACKSAIYDQELNIKGVASEDLRTAFPRFMWAEQSPEDWWAKSRIAIRRSIRAAGIRAKDIVGAGICGQGHGPVLLNRKFRALFPCIIWPDLRAIKQAEFIEANLHREAAAYYTAAKLLWIREKCPKIFKEMWKFVLPKDYIRIKLTDTVLTDSGDAAGTMMYSMEGKSWDYELVDFVGIPRQKLPDVRPSEEVVGEVTRKASAETKLRAGTPVIAGTADYICTRLALECYLKPRKAVVYLGSAPSIFTVGKGGNVVGGFMGIGGATLRWFKERLCCLDSSTVNYEALDKEAEMAEPGSGGLLFLPHMMGERKPAYNPYARGVLFGLSLGHERRNVVRSMMEGVAFQLKCILKSMQDVEKLDEILVIGGGAKSFAWVQVVADIFNVDACMPHSVEMGTLGLAVLLSSSLGFFGSVSEAQKKLSIDVARRASPRREHNQKYDELFSLYCDLEKALARFYGRVHSSL